MASPLFFVKKGAALFLLAVAVVYSSGWAYARLVYPAPFRESLKKTAVEFRLDPLLVGAIVFAESRYRERAVSPAGALGLMQVMPLTGAEVSRDLGLDGFTSEDLLRGDVNLKIGCSYFSKLLKRLDGKEWLALAAYNAGESKIREWMGRAGPGRSRLSRLEFGETRRYVRKIEMIYFGLRLCRAIGAVRA